MSAPVYISISPSTRSRERDKFCMLMCICGYGSKRAAAGESHGSVQQINRDYLGISPPLRLFAIRADGCMLVRAISHWEERHEHNADYDSRRPGGGDCGFHRVGATADAASCRHPR